MCLSGQAAEAGHVDRRGGGDVRAGLSADPPDPEAQAGEVHDPPPHRQNEHRATLPPSTLHRVPAQVYQVGHARIQAFYYNYWHSYQKRIIFTSQDA